MYKQDIALRIAKKTDLDELSSLRLLNLVLDEVSLALTKGKRVTLTGFGTFVIRKRKKRLSYHIRKKEMSVVPAHKSVGFVVGLPLKRAVK